MTGKKRHVYQNPEEQAIVAEAVAQWGEARKSLIDALDMYPAFVAFVRARELDQEFADFVTAYWPELAEKVFGDGGVI